MIAKYAYMPATQMIMNIHLSKGDKQFILLS
jgi:hypothetical protein